MYKESEVLLKIEEKKEQEKEGNNELDGEKILLNESGSDKQSQEENLFLDQLLELFSKVHYLRQ